MYERKHEPLISRTAFFFRLVRHASTSLGIIILSLIIGVLGYRLLEGMSWVDALLNASMLLGGMGPVTELHTTAGKLFASFYALYSGVVFLVIAGIMVAPIFHRLLHHFHLEDEASAENSAQQ